jgi:large subunit ribosomal protein L21
MWGSDEFEGDRQRKTTRPGIGPRVFGYQLGLVLEFGQVYAIIEDGGRQYKVSQGDKIYVDLRELPEGQETIEFGNVLALGEGENARIGQPFVDGAKVVARVGGEVKGHKVISIHFRRRKNYRKKIGHRQKHLAVTISEIVG